MRRLWITRHDAKAEKKAKMNVYIEDTDNGNTEIGGYACRLLGAVENDQVKRFNIGYESARILVLSENADVNTKPAVTQIPGGEEDVFLAGKNYREPGNPFRFDGVEDESEELEELLEEVQKEVKKAAPKKVQKERKPSRGKGKLIIVIAILVGIVAGVAGGIAASSFLMEDTQELAEPKTFRCQDLQIVLTEDFAETSVPGYTTCYTAGDTAVFLMREAFDAKEGFGELDLESYGAMILKNNHIPETVALDTTEGLTTFAWVITDETTGVPYYYYCGLYKSQSAFWMVQVTTEAEDAAQNIPMFRQWLKSVVVAE